MCTSGVDLGHSCRLCGKPLLSCWDDGPSISWHMNAADAVACAEARRQDHRCNAETAVTPMASPGIRA
jgi:hypothetical protein